MRTKLVVALLGALFVAQAGFAADHLVAPSTVRDRLAAAAADRQANVAQVERTLSAPQVASVAGRMGVDVGLVRSAVGSLSDAELQELAQRAAALDTDPVAGFHNDVEMLLIIFLIVAIVILVLKSVD